MQPDHTRQRPQDVARELTTLLRAEGLSRLYWSASHLLAVLSVTSTLTVWSDGLHLRWRHDGTTTTWPAHDTSGAAAHLAGLARATAPAPHQKGHQSR
jgi:hypothetical protein